MYYPWKEFLPLSYHEYRCPPYNKYFKAKNNISTTAITIEDWQIEKGGYEKFAM